VIGQHISRNVESTPDGKRRRAMRWSVFNLIILELELAVPSHRASVHLALLRVRLLICWPITLAADILYLFVFYRAQLLSDALLQVFFVTFTIYGWWHWWRGCATMARCV